MGLGSGVLRRTHPEDRRGPIALRQEQGPNRSAPDSAGVPRGCRRREGPCACERVRGVRRGLHGHDSPQAAVGSDPPPGQLVNSRGHSRGGPERVDPVAGAPPGPPSERPGEVCDFGAGGLSRPPTPASRPARRLPVRRRAVQSRANAASPQSPVPWQTDYVFVSESLAPCVVSCAAVDSGEPDPWQFSDHCPLVLELNG